MRNQCDFEIRALREWRQPLVEELRTCLEVKNNMKIISLIETKKIFKN